MYSPNSLYISRQANAVINQNLHTKNAHRQDIKKKKKHILFFFLRRYNANEPKDTAKHKAEYFDELFDFPNVPINNNIQPTIEIMAKNMLNINSPIL